MQWTREIAGGMLDVHTYSYGDINPAGKVTDALIVVRTTIY